MPGCSFVLPIAHPMPAVRHEVAPRVAVLRLGEVNGLLIADDELDDAVPARVKRQAFDVASRAYAIRKRPALLHELVDAHADRRNRLEPAQLDRLGAVRSRGRSNLEFLYFCCHQFFLRRLAALICWAALNETN